MNEKSIEKALIDAVKRSRGIAPKLCSPSYAGLPDRLVLMPGGRIAFVEVKAPGKKPRPLQISRHRLLMQLGFKVYILDSMEQIKTIIDEIGGDAL